jgi:hypothetical protein
MTTHLHDWLLDLTLRQATLMRLPLYPALMTAVMHDQLASRHSNSRIHDSNLPHKLASLPVALIELLLHILACSSSLLHFNAYALAFGDDYSGQLGSFSPPNSSHLQEHRAPLPILYPALSLAPAAQLHPSNGSMSSPSRTPISQSPPDHDDSWLANPYCHDSFDYDASAPHTPNSDSDHHAASPVPPPSQIP